MKKRIFSFALLLGMSMGLCMAQDCCKQKGEGEKTACGKQAKDKWKPENVSYNKFNSTK